MRFRTIGARRVIHGRMGVGGEPYTRYRSVSSIRYVSLSFVVLLLSTFAATLLESSGDFKSLSPANTGEVNKEMTTRK